jgi:hypothetical protein
MKKAYLKPSVTSLGLLRSVTKHNLSNCDYSGPFGA